MIGVVELRLEDLEVAYLEARRCKGDLEVHGYGRSGPFLLRVRLEQIDLRGQLGFLHAGHALYLPDDGVLGGLVFGLALQADQLDTSSVKGCGHAYLDFLT